MGGSYLFELFSMKDGGWVAGCPYTWFRNLIGKPDANGAEAIYLRVSVTKNKETQVDVALPARSARWLIELIPGEVIDKIREEGIPIDDIQEDLAKRAFLTPEKIFVLNETDRTVDVWLE